MEECKPMPYLLNDHIALRGWRDRPHAIVSFNTGRVRFLTQREWLLLSFCNGQTDLSLYQMVPGQKEMLARAEATGIIRPPRAGEAITAAQRYHFFDNVYMERVHWSITGRCNYRCRHCFLSAPSAQLGEFSTSECLDIIGQLADCGVTQVNLTGGEPLLRKDFFTLVDALLEKHIHIRQIYSNGALVKTPLLKGLADRSIIQMEELECGAAALGMVLAHYGRWLSLEQLRRDCGVSQDGANAFDIIQAVKKYGLSAKGFRYSAQTILEKTPPLPCIAFWEDCHFLVITSVGPRYVSFNDPAQGRMRVTREQFAEHYSNVCLTFQKTPAFTEAGHPVAIRSFVRNRLKGSSAALAFVGLAGLITALVGVVIPLLEQLFVDDVLPAKDSNWNTYFFAMLFLFSGIQIAVTAANSAGLLRIRGKFEMSANTHYMWHVLHLPMGFFSQRPARAHPAGHQPAHPGSGGQPHHPGGIHHRQLRRLPGIFVRPFFTGQQPDRHGPVPPGDADLHGTGGGCDALPRGPGGAAVRGI